MSNETAAKFSLVGIKCILKKGIGRLETGSIGDAPLILRTTNKAQNPSKAKAPYWVIDSGLGPLIPYM